MAWYPPVELTAPEEKLCKRLKTHGRLYAFLRRHRHDILNEPFQRQLDALRSDTPRGQLPLPPAQLVLVLLLQAYTQASDEEAVRRSPMDKAWQMVLGTPGQDEPVFSKATLVHFRADVIAHDLDSVLLARSVQVAREHAGFDPNVLRKLRVTMDSAPLEAVGRKEDTINLLRHALRILVRIIALLLMMTPEKLCERAGLTLLRASSVKAGLDLDGSDSEARDEGARRILAEAQTLEAWVNNEGRSWLDQDRDVQGAKEQVRRIEEQDMEVGPDGQKMIRQGVAKDRQISISEPEARHGHKSKSVLIDGYKRYEAVDLDDELVLEAVVLPANRPEHEGADKMAPTIRTYGEVQELAIDRAFLPSKLAGDVAAAPQGLVLCRP